MDRVIAQKNKAIEKGKVKKEEPNQAAEPEIKDFEPTEEDMFNSSLTEDELINEFTFDFLYKKRIELKSDPEEKVMYSLLVKVTNAMIRAGHRVDER